MASFVVMTAPGRPGPDGPEAAFVRDGFAFLAFLVPALWLLWHRLWVEALVAVAIALGVSLLGTLSGYAVAGSLLSLLVSIYVGLEGAALRIAALRRRGWAEWGVVEADTAEDAETKFVFEMDGLPAAEPASPAAPAMRSFARPASAPGPGLLLNPGNR
ncbi:MAG: DUF2628 domain-containing protein [Rhizobiaceae bacterium]|nr:DUF2628 domain-containing protein [Rhizobiaceae bacterium]